MREIKFRVWDKISKPNKIKTWGQLQAQYNNISQVFNSEGFELMQYTGLKDKRGNEIYEGDIIQLDGDNVTQIIWHEGSFRYIYWGYMTLTKCVAEEVEVIGNIYENIELLNS